MSIINSYDMLGKTILQINSKKLALDDHSSRENMSFNLQGINPSVLVSLQTQYSANLYIKMKRLHYKNNEYQEIPLSNLNRSVVAFIRM